MKHKALLFFSILMVLSMILAACAPQQPQEVEVVKTVIVTEVVEKEGETVIEEKIITATPAPMEEEPEEEMAAGGPIPADEMIPCQPIPEVAGINLEQVSMSVPEIASDIVQPAAAPKAHLNQGGKVYRVGVFEDVTTANFWAANGPDNTLEQLYAA